MAKNNYSKNQKKKFNPLPVIAIAVALLAITLVLFDPTEKKEGNNATAGESNTVSAVDNNSTDNTSTDNTTTETDNKYVPATLNENGDVVIQVADITETATFYEYDSNGTTMGLFAVKASDGTIRTALDTCQVCNGSPYAYFEQKDDTFQCQNCGNLYSLDMIEQERGGCNPVPIMKDEKSVTDTEIIIPASLFDDNAVRFENWKQF